MQDKPHRQSPEISPTTRLSTSDPRHANVGLARSTRYHIVILLRSATTDREGPMRAPWRGSGRSVTLNVSLRARSHRQVMTAMGLDGHIRCWAVQMNEGITVMGAKQTSRYGGQCPSGGQRRHHAARDRRGPERSRHPHGARWGVAELHCRKLAGAGGLELGTGELPVAPALMACRSSCRLAIGPALPPRRSQ